jgi:hypothetical protein
MSSTFFCLQLAICSAPGDPWRGRLVELLRENQADQGLVEKRRLYTHLSTLLAEASVHWTLGTWDLVQGAAADREFDAWVAGLEAAVDEPLDPATSGGDHVVVSVVLLVESGSAADTTLGERCDLPKSEWLTRAAYARLVASLRMLAFAGVRADGVYAVPGDANCGITLAELRGEGWEYLKPVQ